MSRPPLGSIAFLNIPWYSILIVSALLVGALLASREERRLRLPRDTIVDFLLLAVPLAIVGARLYYVAFRWDIYRNDPLRILNIREGGLAIYGGVLTGLLVAWLTAKRKKIRLSLLLDACAPSLMLGQAIGRWGNYANMEAYGLPILDERWQWFPFGVQIQEFGQWVWHQATFFYESIWCFAGFIILWNLRKRLYAGAGRSHALVEGVGGDADIPIGAGTLPALNIKERGCAQYSRTGDLFLWYALLYGAERSLVEGLRLDSLTAGGGLRVSQALSLLAVGAVCVSFFLRKRTRRAEDALSLGASLAAVAAAALSFERAAAVRFIAVGIIALDIALLVEYTVGGRWERMRFVRGRRGRSPRIEISQNNLPRAVIPVVPIVCAAISALSACTALFIPVPADAALGYSFARMACCLICALLSAAGTYASDHAARSAYADMGRDRVLSGAAGQSIALKEDEVTCRASQTSQET